MELIKEDGKYYIKADVTELVEQIKAMVVKTEAPANPDMNQDLYPKDTAEAEAKAEAEALEASEQAAWEEELPRKECTRLATFPAMR